MNHRELTHKWAHAAPDQSRKSGSMSFNGATLYSYSTPIARIYSRKVKGGGAGPVFDDAKLVLVSAHNYSNTTAKHIRYAFRAVSHLNALRVPSYVFGDYAGGRYRGTTDAKRAHADNLAYLENEAARYLKEAQRAQLVRNVAWRREGAGRALDRWKTYAAFFGIRRKVPAFPELEWNAAAARAERIENPNPASADKRERASAARKAANAARYEYREEMRRSMRAAREAADFYPRMCERADWRLDSAFGTAHHSYLINGPVMLRVNGEEIETSQGARIPLAAAPMVWEMVERARRGQSTVTRANGRHLARIGDYPLDRIDADGTLHVGCHVIPHSELRSMARALNLGAA